jgi:hypothetical protein
MAILALKKEFSLKDYLPLSFNGGFSVFLSTNFRNNNHFLGQ